MQCSIPSTTEFNKITQTFRPRCELAGSVSVARVQPGESLVNIHNKMQENLKTYPEHLRASQHFIHRHLPQIRRRHPTCVWPVGPCTGGPVSRGISTYLKPSVTSTEDRHLSARCSGWTLLQLASGSALEINTIPERPLNKVVSPASTAVQPGAFLPTSSRQLWASTRRWKCSTSSFGEEKYKALL